MLNGAGSEDRSRGLWRLELGVVAWFWVHCVNDMVEQTERLANLERLEDRASQSTRIAWLQAAGAGGRQIRERLEKAQRGGHRAGQLRAQQGGGKREGWDVASVLLTAKTEAKSAGAASRDPRVRGRRTALFTAPAIDKPPCD